MEFHFCRSRVSARSKTGPRLSNLITPLLPSFPIFLALSIPLNPSVICHQSHVSSFLLSLIIVSDQWATMSSCSRRKSLSYQQLISVISSDKQVTTTVAQSLCLLIFRKREEAVFDVLYAINRRQWIAGAPFCSRCPLRVSIPSVYPTLFRKKKREKLENMQIFFTHPSKDSRPLAQPFWALPFN